jgi:hypothetical protein
MAISKRTSGRARMVSGLLAIGTLAVFGSQASAATVSYEWVPNAGQTGTGLLTLSSNLIVDPNNFTAIPIAALTSIAFTFTDSGTVINDPNGAAAGGDIDTYQLALPGFSASAGLLTTTFNFSSTRAFPTFILALNSSGGNPSGVSLQTDSVFPPEQHFGTWRVADVSSVPLPAGLPLLLSAIAAVGLFVSRGRTSQQSTLAFA